MTPPFLGIAQDAVGPNSFSDNTKLSFSPPVDAVGMDIIGDLIGPVSVGIDVYDANNTLLGSTTSTGSAAGTFFGVTSTQPITLITLTDANGGGELIGNLHFGNLPTPVPTLAPFAMVLLILTLGGSAYLIRRQR